MPPSVHGRYESRKSAWSFESYDSGWEREYMEELDSDPGVAAWTKRHDIGIPYTDSSGKRRVFRPDFLVKLQSGKLELRETKGGHLLKESKLKFEAGKAFCAARDMRFVVVTKGQWKP